MLNLTRERTTMEISFKLCCAILGAFYMCMYYMYFICTHSVPAKTAQFQT